VTDELVKYALHLDGERVWLEEGLNSIAAWVEKDKAVYGEEFY